MKMGRHSTSDDCLDKESSDDNLMDTDSKNKKVHQGHQKPTKLSTVQYLARGAGKNNL
jgi:hypothetical protein